MIREIVKTSCFFAFENYVFLSLQSVILLIFNMVNCSKTMLFCFCLLTFKKRRDLSRTGVCYKQSRQILMVVLTTPIVRTLFLGVRQEE